MPVNARGSEPSMEEILASIRRIISDEVAADPAAARSDAPRPARDNREASGRDVSSREAPASRVSAPAREPAARPAAPQRPAASTESSEALSYAPSPYRERVESPVDYAPRGRAPATDPFTPRPVTVAAAALAAPAFAPSAMASRAPTSSVYSGGSAARALDVPQPARPVSESRAPEPRRVEPRLFPDSRPLPDLRPLTESRPRPEPRLVEPRSPAPAFTPEVRAPASAVPARPALGSSLNTPLGGPGMAALPPVRPSFARPSVIKPLAPLDSELDKPLAAALLDLALVEQAVQAELANVALTEPAASGAASVEPAAEPLRASAAPAPATPALTPDAGPATVEPVPPEPAMAAANTASGPEAVAHPVAEPIEMPAPAARASLADPAREGTALAAPVKDESTPIAPAPRPDARAAEPRPVEARPAEPRGHEANLAEARLSEARLAESRLSESRLVASNRPSAAPETAEPVRERLVSAPASSAVSAAFGSLQRTMSAAPPRSVDDLVTEALKPMLKAWLDENLPALVERLVRAEIERVARHGQ